MKHLITTLDTQVSTPAVYAFAYTLNDMTYLKIGKADDLGKRLSEYTTVLDGGIEAFYVDVPRETLYLVEKGVRDMLKEELPYGWRLGKHEYSNRPKETFQAIREDMAWKQRGDVLAIASAVLDQWVK